VAPAPPPARVEAPPPAPPPAQVASPPPAAAPSPGATEQPPVATRSATEADGAQSGVGGRTIAMISLLGVGTAAVILAAFEGLSASSKAETVSAQSKSNNVFDPAIETAGRRANAIAITSGLVGAAALGVGGYLFLTRPTATEEAPGSRVSIAPWVTPSGLVGAGAAWSY
jgi:hypothetical protein